MTTAQQLSLLRVLTGDPSSDPRFTDAEYVLLLNLARQWFCDFTESFQIRDRQTTVSGTGLYDVKRDVIRFDRVEWDGVDLGLGVQPADWRRTIGDDDTLEGTPFCYKYWARQLQLFYVPNDAKTLVIEGIGYAADLAENGDDVDLIDAQARACIYRAAAIAKGTDERLSETEERMSLELAGPFKANYRPKGPRFARPALTVPDPIGVFRRF